MFWRLPVDSEIWRLTVVFCLAKCLLSPDCPAYLGKELFIFHDAVSDHQAVFMFFQLIDFVLLFFVGYQLCLIVFDFI